MYFSPVSFPHRIVTHPFIEKSPPPSPPPLSFAVYSLWLQPCNGPAIRVSACRTITAVENAPQYTEIGPDAWKLLFASSPALASLLAFGRRETFAISPKFPNTEILRKSCRTRGELGGFSVNTSTVHFPSAH